MSKSIMVNRAQFVAEMVRQDITVEELSQKAGVGTSAVQSMRRGRPVWRTTAQHVARALNVSLESLLPDREA